MQEFALICNLKSKNCFLFLFSTDWNMLILLKNTSDGNMQKAWLVLHLQILSICKRTVGKPHKYKDDATVAKGSCLCPVLPCWDLYEKTWHRCVSEFSPLGKKVMTERKGKRKVFFKWRCFVSRFRHAGYMGRHSRVK